MLKRLRSELNVSDESQRDVTKVTPDGPLSGRRSATASIFLLFFVFSSCLDARFLMECNSIPNVWISFRKMFQRSNVTFPETSARTRWFLFLEYLFLGL